MYSVQDIKQKFKIIGNSITMNRAIQRAIKVANTDVSVLVSGESGVGKEFIPKIIHYTSSRKHNHYIAINCGALPEGTIDSELFGHEKGSFTGAITNRKGYFEAVDGGSIFLDEIADLPLSTQVKLLRILETGEFMKVGSSKVHRTSFRIIAATNIDLLLAIKQNKFREDLFYRLNTVQINIPPLRERKDDIELLFKKFSNDFKEKYNVPSIKLTIDSLNCIQNYYWPGNVRQLRNLVENISILEIDKIIDASTMQLYLDSYHNYLSINKNHIRDINNNRCIYDQILFKISRDITCLKRIMLDIIKNNKKMLITTFNNKNKLSRDLVNKSNISYNSTNNKYSYLNNSLLLHNQELECIKRALKKSQGIRKIAAKILGISERTLYRKIKQYDL